MNSKVLRAMLFYGIDLLIVIFGFTVGFGLTVHNWFALVSIMLVWRLLAHIIGMAFMADDAKYLSDAEKLSAKRWDAIVGSEFIDITFKKEGLGIAVELDNNGGVNQSKKDRAFGERALTEYADALIEDNRDRID